MEITIKILQFFASLSLLVLVHELGHFFAARMFGVRVDKFYIFFNPWFSLVKFKIGQTEFGIGWIPFGGYCKIAGMIDESMDTEQMKLPARPDEFRSKPAWQRLIIMTGGVIMNLVLALVIFIGMSYAYGERYVANDELRYGYVFNDAGHEAGFRDGDRILSVGGKHIENYLLVQRTIVFDNAPVEVLRGDERIMVTVPQGLIARILDSPDFMEARIPFVVGKVVAETGAALAGIQPMDSLVAVNGRELFFHDEYQKAFAELKGQTADITVARDSAGVTVFRTLPVAISEQGTIGVKPFGPAAFMPVQTKYYSLLESIPAGFHRTGEQISDYWKQLKLIVSPKTEAYKSLGGFMAIGSFFPSTWDWPHFWSITALLSIILAVMNMLPIPMLDGGHVMFLLWEVVTGRKPSDKFLEHAMTVGMILLFALLLYANGNDIYRFFIKN